MTTLLQPSCRNANIRGDCGSSTGCGSRRAASLCLQTCRRHECCSADALLRRTDIGTGVVASAFENAECVLDCNGWHCSAAYDAGSTCALIAAPTRCCSCSCLRHQPHEGRCHLRQGLLGRLCHVLQSRELACCRILCLGGQIRQQLEGEALGRGIWVTAAPNEVLLTYSLHVTNRFIETMRHCPGWTDAFCSCLALLRSRRSP